MAPQRCLPALLLLVGAVQAKQLLKGISYGPSPKTSLGPLPNDDFMCEAARPQWGSEGRGDLALMKKMGATAVRLYGNDPRENHRGFLDEAERVGLGLIPGLSDWPYVQAPDSCQTTNYDCYWQAKDAYLQTLLGGFVRDGQYHPAVQYMVAVNEPDMKLPNVGAPMSFTKALISALDGILDAEKEANVTSGRMPNITVTFSFSICSACGGLTKKPGLGQMWQLRDAMANPSKYDYAPRNDLWAFYTTRFVNSFNTANPAFELRKLFLKDYEAHFRHTPTFIAEYHAPNQETAKDLANALKIAKTSPLLLGVSFFEWENRQDEQGHTTFGLFELGRPAGVRAYSSTMSFFGSDYEVPCLVPTKGAFGEVIAKSVAKAFGGVYKPAEDCTLDAETTTTTTSTSTAAEEETSTTTEEETSTTEEGTRTTTSEETTTAEETSTTAAEEASTTTAEEASTTTAEKASTTTAEETSTTTAEAASTTTTEETGKTTAEVTTPEFVAGPQDPSAGTPTAGEPLEPSATESTAADLLPDSVVGSTTVRRRLRGVVMPSPTPSASSQGDEWA